MKAREQLNWLLESGGWNVDDSAAALRELDGLLADSFKLITLNAAGQFDKQMERGWLERARKAGYE